MKGVGPKRAQRFEKLGIRTLEDLIYYLPWRYEDRSQIRRIADLQPGLEQTVMGWVRITSLKITPRKRLAIFELLIEDSSGFLKAIWFNQPYLKEVFRKNRGVVLSGLVTFNRYDNNRLHMESPRYEFIEEGEEELIHMGRIVPIYHETVGCSSRQLRGLIRSTLNRHAEGIPDILPPILRDRHGLLPLNKAIERVHFPEEGMDLDMLNRGESPAHERLIFDELLLLEIGVGLRKKEQVKEHKELPFHTSGDRVQRLMKILPFSLTKAQQRVIHEIKRDMAQVHPMNRLLQGDVGCGKTIVGLFALLIAVDNGAQAALMAPTEILAEQHFLTLRVLLKELGIETVFLTSSIKKKERETILQQIQTGRAQIVIGTHSLLQEEVRFSRLGVAVIDEQHKFGVLQRALLRRKGYHPDLLIMTATPIPRTLALSVYGDLDLSIIDEQPPERRAIQTEIIYERERGVAYKKIEQEIEKGRQAYIVVPLVEESEKVDLKAAIDMAKTLQEVIFPSLRVGLLHGRIPTDQREAVMGDFKEGRLHLLVATTVIEVGIDVPNATIMLVDHAERFGLAQLHQLRGRIGRGPHPSRCLLLAHPPLSPEAKKRLEAMMKYQDGFSIAEEDLAIRGPGEFLGTRQSGIPELRVASLIRDVRLLEKARQEAMEILQQDPDLSLPDHQLLRQALYRKWQDRLEFMTLG